METWYTDSLVSVAINPTRWWQEPNQFFNVTMAVIDIAAWYHGVRHRKVMTKYIELVPARLDGAWSSFLITVLCMLGNVHVLMLLWVSPRRPTP